MKIAIASGKGGTGKTTVSASLVSIWETPVIAMDLDVEEPNLHLFLNPQIDGREDAFMEVPEPDETRCNQCGKCVDICQFKAISLMGTVILTYPEMCHGCGGCVAVCPEGALSPGRRKLGEVTWGRIGGNGFLMGRLRVGEAMSPPLMRAVRQKLLEMTRTEATDVIIDAPPGVSCPAVNAVMDADAIILVTEPTPFGFYDMKLAHDAFSSLGKPMGVVVNRAGLGMPDIYEYCSDAGLEIVAEIPYDRRVAEAYSQGRIISDVSADLRRCFADLAGRLKKMTDPSVLREAGHG